MNKNQKPSHDDNEDSGFSEFKARKKAYHGPELEHLGSLCELIRGGTGNFSDDQSESASFG